MWYLPIYFIHFLKVKFYLKIFSITTENCLYMHLSLIIFYIVNIIKNFLIKNIYKILIFKLLIKKSLFFIIIRKYIK